MYMAHGIGSFPGRPHGNDMKLYAVIPLLSNGMCGSCCIIRLQLWRDCSGNPLPGGSGRSQAQSDVNVHSVRRLSQPKSQQEL